MSNISRTMSVMLRQNMTVTEMIDVLVHIEKECNQNNMKLYFDKELVLVDEQAFKPLKQQTHIQGTQNIKNYEVW